MDVADIPVMTIVGHVEGRRAARGSDVATRKKIKRKSSPWMLPEVDMHAGKKTTCRLRRYVSR